MPSVRVTSKNPLILCLIADDSGSMSGQPAQEVTNGVRDLILLCQTYGGGEKNYFKVLLVKFGTSAEIMEDLTPILSVDANRIDFKGVQGATNMGAAMQLVYDKLKKHQSQDPLDPAPIIIFWSDGQNNGLDPLPVAEEIKRMTWPCGLHPQIITCGFGNVDENLLRTMASSPEHYKAQRNAEELRAFLGNIGTVLSQAGRPGTTQEQIIERIKDL